MGYMQRAGGHAIRHASMHWSCIGQVWVDAFAMGQTQTRPPYAQLGGKGSLWHRTHGTLCTHCLKYASCADLHDTSRQLAALRGARGTRSIRATHHVSNKSRSPWHRSPLTKCPDDFRSVRGWKVMYGCVVSAPFEVVAVCSEGELCFVYIAEFSEGGRSFQYCCVRIRGWSRKAVAGQQWSRPGLRPDSLSSPQHATDMKATGG